MLILLAHLTLGLGMLVGNGSGAGETQSARGSVPQREAKSLQRKASAAVTPEQILEARRLLGELGYWVELDLDRPDDSLYHAMVAFQKVEGRPINGRLTAEEISALKGARRPLALETGYPHIEVDLKRQILMVVDCCGAILRILPVSSGSGELFTEGGRTRRAVTPVGRFKVYRKVAGWRRSPLGLLYYPSYINEGIAIHGSPSVPTKPASHGCIRVPMFAARELFEMMPEGREVIVYSDEATASRSLP